MYYINDTNLIRYDQYRRLCLLARSDGSPHATRHAHSPVVAWRPVAPVPHQQFGRGGGRRCRDSNWRRWPAVNVQLAAASSETTRPVRHGRRRWSSTTATAESCVENARFVWWRVEKCDYHWLEYCPQSKKPIHAHRGGEGGDLPPP